MASDTEITGGEPEEAGESWSARKLRPILVVQVAAVFAVFMAIAYFIVHSPTAVKALAVAAVGAILPLLAELNKRFEYRIIGGRLERRILAGKKPRDFEPVFRVDELSHIQPTRDGFKYTKSFSETNPLRRFWKLHVSDAYSREFRVDSVDRERVAAVLVRLGVEVRRGRLSRNNGDEEPVRKP